MRQADRELDLVLEEDDRQPCLHSRITLEVTAWRKRAGLQPCSLLAGSIAPQGQLASGLGAGLRGAARCSRPGAPGGTPAHTRMKGSPGPRRSSPTLHRTVRPSGRTAEHCPPNAYSHRALLTQSLTRGFESGQGALFAQQASFPHYFHVGLAYLIIMCALARRTFPPGERPGRPAVAPAGSTWGGSGGDEWAEALQEKGLLREVSEPRGLQRAVNAEQAPRTPMWEPTRHNNGEGRSLLGSERRAHRGVPPG